MNLKDAGIYDIFNIFTGKPSNRHSSSSGTMISDQSADEIRFINIPAYQRPYRWDYERITQLFHDYDDNNNNSDYFIGSAVAVQRKKQNSQGQTIVEFDIVDGQQRITTLYLLNYIRFLLLKETTLDNMMRPFNPNAISDCEKIRDAYVGLIGTNRKPFDNIIDKINNLTREEDIQIDDTAKQIEECYRQEMHIPSMRSSASDTIEEIKRQLKLFFKDETLCLKYSRDRYNQTLKDALSCVYLKQVENTNNFELCVIDDSEVSDFTKNYTTVLTILFDEIWKRAIKKSSSIVDASKITISKSAITIIDEMLKNLSICVVITEKEDDANKLFEVLNDRSLEVEDLELIKNHFYKEYCTKSNDADEVKDHNITELDTLWTDVIFDSRSTSQQKSKYISYLAAIFLTLDDNLEAKKPGKIKNIIDREYSKNIDVYDYSLIKKDFNVYYAIKLLLNKFDYAGNNEKFKKSLEAEKTNRSITYKAFHLLNAFDYLSVIPALTNVILSTYINDGNSMTDSNFKTQFENYLDELINDYKHENEKFKKIHKCAFVLWVSTLKSKDAEIPRSIAKRIIKDYGNSKYSNSNLDFEHDESRELTKQLGEWLDNWNYNSGSKKIFAVKVLLLNLLFSKKVPETGSDSFVLRFTGGLTYNLDAGKLELDHLEANKPNNTIITRYYKSDSLEQRNKDVNSYLGNFMILDKDENNNKNNVPLCEALNYYDTLENSWMIKEIREMLLDSKYYDVSSNIPKEAFFVTRSKRLKNYIKAFLNKDLNAKEINITL